MAGKALWSGRFDGGMDEGTLMFTTSLDVDSRMAFYDVMGSLAHVRMLKARGIIPAEDADLITDGLRKIAKTVEAGELELDYTLEDIHTNIETKLTNMIGPAGGKLHTGRSRNDQVATDFKMYIRDAALGAVEAIDRLIASLQDVAKANGETVLPGFTHLQHAQPVTLAQHMLAHAFRFGRDADRFMDALERMNKCPLGSAALAGTTYDIDRKMTSDLLGFKDPTENSMDTVGSRDFVTEFAFDASMAAISLSSLCEELVLWSSQVFGFVTMDDRYSTGSSIMPQKKNPDICELTRGKTGGIIGSLVTMLVTTKSLPLAYNRDLQEDKKPVMDSLQTLTDCANIMAKVVATMTVNKERMLASTNAGFINATDLADYLVTKNVPFREAHAIVGAAVKYCESNGLTLGDLPLEKYKEFSPLIEEDVYKTIEVMACVERRISYGGTSPASTDAQMLISLQDLFDRESAVRQKNMFFESCWKELLGE
ncbi:MAG: argininosuccinate lyase [archaeon]|nr:argininosuccinate lyase [archaeon]